MISFGRPGAGKARVWIGGGFLPLLLAACGPTAPTANPPAATSSVPVSGESGVSAVAAGGAAPLPMIAGNSAVAEQLQLAEALAQQGKTNEAMRRMTHLVAAHPDYEEAHFSLGFLQNRMGRTGDAIHSYEQALRLVPDYAEAHNNLGNLLVKEQRFEDALPHFDAAITKIPDNPNYHNNRGIALARSSKPAEAITEFNRAVQLDAEYPDAWFNLGRVFSETGQLREAVLPLQTTLRLRPNSEAARRLLEEIQRKLSGPQP